MLTNPKITHDVSFEERRKEGVKTRKFDKCNLTQYTIEYTSE